MVEPRTTAEPCMVHLYHSPRPQYQEVHHILPLSWGGPDAPDNRIAICPTGHRNVHRLLDSLRHDLEIDLRSWGANERALAMRAWDLWLAMPDQMRRDVAAGEEGHGDG